MRNPSPDLFLRKSEVNSHSRCSEGRINHVPPERRNRDFHRPDRRERFEPHTVRQIILDLDRTVIAVL